MNDHNGVDIGANNISLKSLFAIAQENGIILPNGDYTAPHKMSEFLGMNYSTVPPGSPILRLLDQDGNEITWTQDEIILDVGDEVPPYIFGIGPNDITLNFEPPAPPEPVISKAQISINNGSQRYFMPYEYQNGVGHMHLPVLVKATCSTLGLNNDYLGMMFIFQSQTFGHHWFSLGLDGMEYHPLSQSWSAYGDVYTSAADGRREHTCTYIRLVKYTGEGWYNIGRDNTTDHDTSVLKHPHSGVSIYTDACTTAWSPQGQSIPDGHFTQETLGDIPGGWTNGICVARNLGFDALYGPASPYGRGAGYPRIGASYVASANSINWSDLFEGDFQINNFIEYGSDPSYRAVASLGDAQNINSGWLDGCAGPKASSWDYWTTAGMTVNQQAWSSSGGNKGWSQVHKFIDNPPQ
jgi:hypothetical protein